MIVGVYEPSGECVVLPLEQVAQHYKVTEYHLRKALNGEAHFKFGILVKMPKDAVWRYPTPTIRRPY